MIELKENYTEIDLELILIDRGIHFGLFKQFLTLARVDLELSINSHYVPEEVVTRKIAVSQDASLTPGARSQMLAQLEGEEHAALAQFDEPAAEAHGATLMDMEQRLELLMREMKDEFNASLQRAVLEALVNGSAQDLTIEDIAATVPTPLTNDTMFSAQAARDFNAAIMDIMRTWVLQRS